MSVRTEASFKSFRIFLFLLTSLLSFVPAQAQTPPSSDSLDSLERPRLLLSVGEQRLLRIPGLERYAAGSEGIRIARPPKGAADQLLLKAVHPGMNDLWVWKSDGTSEHRPIEVVAGSLDRGPPALLTALSALTEVEVLPSGGGVTLRGKITQMKEAARVAALLRGYPNELRDETTTDDALLETGKSAIIQWLKGSQLGDRIQIQREGQALFVTGSLPRPSEKTQLEKQIRSLFPLAQIELDSLPDSSPTIYFKVFLLELKKSRFRSLGIEWPGSQSGAFRVTRWGLQESLQLDLALNALESDGSARVLSRPELVVRAPGEAELFAGGELPIRTQTHYSSNVTWKSYGLMLRLKVTHTTADRVRLDLSTEVSHLEPNSGADALPGLQANRLKTQIDASFGKPLFLSGLLQDEWRKQAKGLPFLKSIPVLGSLFGSEDFLAQRSELVAILLPMSRPPESAMQRLGRTSPRWRSFDAELDE